MGDEARPSGPVARLLELLLGVERTVTGYQALCPAHDDHDPSLAVAEGEDGRALVYCHAGCTLDAVLAALQLTRRDLFEKDDTDRAAPVVFKTTRFPFLDSTGRLVAEHIRKDFANGRRKKKYLWRRNGKWELGDVRPIDLPLYGAHTLANAAPGSTVLVVEGEPATDALSANGVLAAGSVTGADTIPSDAVLEQLRDFNVIVWPDNDDPGRTHMRRIGERLIVLGMGCRVLTWDDAPASGDAADYFAMGGTVEGLQALMAEAPMLDARFDSTENLPNRASENGSGFQLTPVADLMAEPEPDTAWLVDGILPASGVSLLAAKPKVGKSTLARNLAVVVASGRVGHRTSSSGAGGAGRLLTRAPKRTSL